MRKLRIAAALAAAAATVWLCSPENTVPAETSDTPQWIWFPEGNPRASAPAGARWFRKSFTLAKPVDKAEFQAVADNSFELFVNGKRIGAGNDWREMTKLDLAAALVV